VSGISLFLKNRALGILSTACLFSIAIASMGLEIDYCELCQNSYMNLTLIVDRLNETDNSTYTQTITQLVPADGIWLGLPLFGFWSDDDEYDDTFNITSWDIDPIPCEYECLTVVKADYGLAALFAGLGIGMFYITFSGYMDTMLDTDKKKLYDVKW